jgi:polysaccharide export outer membrane protein
MNTPGNVATNAPRNENQLASVLEATRHIFSLPGRQTLAASGILLGLLGLLLAASPALAQFTGPALSTPTTDRGVMVPTPSTQLLDMQHSSIHLEPGDLIAIHLFGSGDYQPVVRVSLDGSIQLPLIGIVPVRGLTIDQAENLIAERLKSSGMYRDPQVTIDISESSAQVVTVSGELHAVVPVTGERRLLEILSIAGGLPSTASHTISIDRPGTPDPIVVNLGTDPLHSKQSNISIFPGETMIVSRVGVVYMLGEFKAPGAIPILQNSPLTLLEATALGGGLNFDGRYKDLRIIRTVNRQRTLVRVDVKQVMLGREPDPILQADDIVFLPTSPMKAAIASGGPGILLNLASVLLIAIYH